MLFLLFGSNYYVAISEYADLSYFVLVDTLRSYRLALFIATVGATAGLPYKYFCILD